MTSQEPLQEIGGVRVAFEGCGHGTLDAIYAGVKNAAKVRGWDNVDLLIIGGDFQAVRNVPDITVMSVPTKYRHLGDFPKYYSGAARAPIPTLFIGGNHEAASHLWELYYGGWVAPNIYYMGAANVLRFGPLRIAGMSGIWKGYNYNRPHIERLPFNGDDIKSFYHIREIDVRKLLQIREQVDVGVSHDWPRAIERHGDEAALFREKPFFANESRDGTLGSAAAAYVLDRLRPPYWLSAHMHCKFTAIKTFDAPKAGEDTVTSAEVLPAPIERPAPLSAEPAANPDEIDLDMDDDDADADADVNPEPPKAEPQEAKPAATETTSTPATSIVPDELRAQLPAAFARPISKPKTIPGQPVPLTITNTQTRFLALDKARPGNKFLQLSYLTPAIPATAATTQEPTKPKLEYDPEWLAITRVFHQYLVFGGEDRDAKLPADLGEEVYKPMIDAERAWVEEHVVQPGKLAVPENFAITAPPMTADEVVPDLNHVNVQPEEYTNPQTVAFCELLELPNLWDASPEERAQRRRKGAPQSVPRRDRDGNRGGGGGRGGRGGYGGHGRGRGGRGQGRGRGGWH